MQKLFFIILFIAGAIGTTQAQTFCVDENDAPGTTGGTGFISSFDFPSAYGTDTVWLGVDTTPGQTKAGVYFPNQTVDTTFTELGTDAQGNYICEAQVLYGNWYYVFTMVIQPGTNHLLSYDICRTFI